MLENGWLPLAAHRKRLRQGPLVFLPPPGKAHGAQASWSRWPDVVEFKRPEVPKDLVGKEPTELSTTSYGATEAWLLLEPAAAKS